MDLDATQPFFTSTPIRQEENNEVIVSPDRPSSSFQSPINSPAKKRPCNSLVAFTELGCKTYDTRRFNTKDVADLLLSKRNIRLDKVCKAIPPGPLSRGQFTFVVDLNSINPTDLSVDGLGKYKRPSQRKHCYQVKEDHSYVSHGARKPEKEWNAFIRINTYYHPGVEGPDQLVLEDGHRHHLLEQFGTNSFPDAQTDWRENPVSKMKPRRGTM